LLFIRALPAIASADQFERCSESAAVTRFNDVLHLCKEFVIRGASRPGRVGPLHSAVHHHIDPIAYGRSNAARDGVFPGRRDRLHANCAQDAVRPVDYKAVPEPLAKLNFIYLNDPLKFDENADKLAEALNTDIGLIRQHTDFAHNDLTTVQNLVASDRANTVWLRDLAMSYEKIGSVLVEQGKLLIYHSIDLSRELGLDSSCSGFGRPRSAKICRCSRALEFWSCCECQLCLPLSSRSA
jgi:hypothetical protein